MSSYLSQFALGEIPESCKDVVVAVQLGATTSGIAFAYKAVPGSVACGAPKTLDPTQTQVPTSLLQLDNGTWAFGFDAEAKYSQLLCNASSSADILPGQLYKQFPSQLDNKMSDHDSLTAISERGVKHALVDLFVQALQFLKDYAMERIAMGFGKELNPCDDIQWVITVPTSWNDFGRAFLRKAAFRADMMNSEQSDNLFLVWEPECAALAVHVGSPEAGILRPANRFMVLECKGEATFLTVHEVETLQPISLRAIALPSVFYVGGNSVKSEFEKFLAEFLGPDLYQPQETPLEFYMLFEEFRKLSIMFDPLRDPSNMQMMDLLESKKQLVSLIESYNSKHPDKAIPVSPVNRNGFLGLSKELMLSFFEPALRVMVEEIGRALRTSVGIKHLIVVGSFASSKVVTSRMQSEFHGKNGLNVVVCETSPKPQGAVVHGAVYFGLYKPLFKTETMCVEQDRAALQSYADQVALLTARLNDVLLAVAAHDKTLFVLVNKQKECPSLFWFYPKRRDLRNWLLDPAKCLFQDTLMMMVVCPVTLSVVPCGPEGTGWELSVPKQWVKRWGPAIVFSIYVLQAAVVEGRVVGIPLPQLPSASAITGLSSTVIGTSVDSMVNQESVMQSLTGLASTAAAVMDPTPEMQALCACVQERGKGGQQPVSEPVVPKELLDDAYKSMHAFLTSGENAKLGKLEDQLRGSMERVVAENGDVDWVSVEGRDAWLEKRRHCQSSTPSATPGGSIASAPQSPGATGTLAAEDRAAIRELQRTVKELQATVQDLTLQIRQLRSMQEGAAPGPPTPPSAPIAETGTKKKSSFLFFHKKS